MGLGLKREPTTTSAPCESFYGKFRERLCFSPQGGHLRALSIALGLQHTGIDKGTERNDSQAQAEAINQGQLVMSRRGPVYFLSWADAMSTELKGARI